MSREVNARARCSHNGPHVLDLELEGVVVRVAALAPAAPIVGPDRVIARQERFHECPVSLARCRPVHEDERRAVTGHTDRERGAIVAIMSTPER